MKYQSLLDTLMQEGVSNTGDVGCTVTLSILPISIRHTSTHVVFYPDSTLVDGDEFIETVLIGTGFHYSACITSSTMPEEKRRSVTERWARSEKSTLYFTEIEVVIYSGPMRLKDGIGVQRLELSRIIQMPNFWKPGFSMTMELCLSRGLAMSLINV